VHVHFKQQADGKHSKHHKGNDNHDDDNIIGAAHA